MSEHTLTVVIHYVTIALGIYIFAQWHKNRQDSQPISMSPPDLPPLVKIPLIRRLLNGLKAFTLYAVIMAIISGLVFFLPEKAGRHDSTAFCEDMQVGQQMNYDTPTLQQNFKQFKTNYSTLFAANYYPKSSDLDDGTGGIVFVFLGGYPFSRAYCVLNLDKGVIKDKQVMFNAEDYEYCNGEMRGIWECDQSMNVTSK